MPSDQCDQGIGMGRAGRSTALPATAPEGQRFKGGIADDGEAGGTTRAAWAGGHVMMARPIATAAVID